MQHPPWPARPHAARCNPCTPRRAHPHKEWPGGVVKGQGQETANCTLDTGGPPALLCNNHTHIHIQHNSHPPPANCRTSKQVSWGRIWKQGGGRGGRVGVGRCIFPPPAPCGAGRCIDPLPCPGKLCREGPGISCVPYPLIPASPPPWLLKPCIPKPGCHERAREPKLPAHSPMVPRRSPKVPAGKRTQAQARRSRPSSPNSPRGTSRQPPRHQPTAPEAPADRPQRHQLTAPESPAGIPCLTALWYMYLPPQRLVVHVRAVSLAQGERDTRGSHWSVWGRGGAAI